jgi:thioredoxin 1
MAGNVVEVSDAEFESSIIQSDKPALVDFWAEWCQPCKMLAPTVEEIAGEYIDKVRVAKVNVDDNPATATKFGIRGIPTLLLFKGGKVVQQMVGVKPKSDIIKAIDEIL